MRRSTFVLFAALGLTVATAGGADAQEVVLGAKGGINIADFSVDDEEATDTDTRTGVVGGLFASFGLGKVLAIRPEVLWAGKGATALDVEGEGVDLEFELDYVEVPVLLGARLASAGPVRPVLYAGPVVSFETSCEVEASVGGGEAEGVDCDDPEADALERKSTDFGVAFGGGLEVGSGPVVLVLDGRYTLGLVDIDDSMDATEVRNRALSLMAGIGIRIR